MITCGQEILINHEEENIVVLTANVKHTCYYLYVQYIDPLVTMLQCYIAISQTRPIKLVAASLVSQHIHWRCKNMSVVLWRAGPIRGFIWCIQQQSQKSQHDTAVVMRTHCIKLLFGPLGSIMGSTIPTRPQKRVIKMIGIAEAPIFPHNQTVNTRP